MLEMVKKIKIEKQKVEKILYSLLIIYLSYLFILTLFIIDLKLHCFTQKSSYRVYSNNIELIEVNSVTE